MSGSDIAAEIIGVKQLRSFGLLVGGIFAAIGVWPILFHQAGPRWWCVGLASYLAIAGAVFPKSLYWIYKGWMWLGHKMGWINTRVILGLAFFGLVTPIGIFRSKMLGKDPMGKKLRPDLQSYRIATKPRSASHLTKQY